MQRNAPKIDDIEEILIGYSNDPEVQKFKNEFKKRGFTETDFRKDQSSLVYLNIQGTGLKAQVSTYQNDMREWELNYNSERIYMTRQKIARPDPRANIEENPYAIFFLEQNALKNLPQSLKAPKEKEIKTNLPKELFSQSKQTESVTSTTTKITEQSQPESKVVAKESKNEKKPVGNPFTEWLSSEAAKTSPIHSQVKINSPVFPQDVKSAEILKSTGPTWLIRESSQPGKLAVTFLNNDNKITSVLCRYCGSKEGWLIGDEKSKYLEAEQKVNKDNFFQFDGSDLIDRLVNKGFDKRSMAKAEDYGSLSFRNVHKP